MSNKRRALGEDEANYIAIESTLRAGRGMAEKSLDLIEAMYKIAEAAKPITGRGVGYKLFVLKLIPSMDLWDMWPEILAYVISPVRGEVRAA